MGRVIHKEELPEFKELLNWVIDCDRNDIKIGELKEFKDQYLRTSQKVIIDCEDFFSSKEDGMYGMRPERILLILGDYRAYLSAMIGLGETLAHKLEATVYHELAKVQKEPEEGENKPKRKSKYTQAERKSLSEMETASIKGIVSTLKSFSFIAKDKQTAIQGRNNRM